MSLISPHGVCLVLLGFLGWPVVTSWLAALASKPWQENGVQLGAVLLMIVAIRQSLQKKNSTPDDRPGASPMGWLVLLAASLAYLAADFYWVKSVLWVSYIGMLAGYCWAMRGRHAFLRWLPVFLFSGFLLPTVNAEIQMAVSLPLQVASAKLAAWLTGWLVPVSATDTLISIGENSLRVTPACSGLQSWMGFLFAGLLWHMFEGARPRQVFWLIPGALCVSLMLNAIRLAITVLVAYYDSIEQALAWHTNLDWILFPIGLLLLWQVGLRFRELEIVRVERIAKASVSNNEHPWQSSSSIAGLLGLGTLVTVHLWLADPISAPQSSPLTPMQIAPIMDGWTGTDLPVTPEEQRAFGAAQGLNREYTRGPESYLWVKILQSGSVADIHNFYGCLMVQGIRPNQLKPLRIQTPSGVLNAMLLEFEYEGTGFDTVLWHQWGAETAASRWQWYQAVLQERLQHRTHPWKIVKLTMPKTASDPQKNQQERRQLVQFATDVYRQLSTQ